MTWSSTWEKFYGECWKFRLQWEHFSGIVTKLIGGLLDYGLSRNLKRNILKNNNKEKERKEGMVFISANTTPTTTSYNFSLSFSRKPPTTFLHKPFILVSQFTPLSPPSQYYFSFHFIDCGILDCACLNWYCECYDGKLLAATKR